MKGAEPSDLLNHNGEITGGTVVMVGTVGAGGITVGVVTVEVTGEATDIITEEDTTEAGSMANSAHRLFH